MYCYSVVTKWFNPFLVQIIHAPKRAQACPNVLSCSGHVIGLLWRICACLYKFGYSCFYMGILPCRTSSEGLHLGGPRVVTFMIYLSSVEAGGHTIFPQPGISIKPVAGSALFWFNMGAQNNFDSRVMHLGCPGNN